MSFNVSLLDATFVALLGILAVTRVAWPRRSQVPLLLVGSAAVIGLGSLRTLVVISAITLVFIYPLQRLVKLAVDRRWPRVVAAALLPGGLVVLVGLLLLFKIYNEFSLPWLGGQWIRKEVLAIVGFSYFIFRTISIL